MGLDELSRVVFDCNDEPTSLHDDGGHSTIVKPLLFVAPADVPVVVRNGALVSLPLTFSFTEPAARKRK